MIIDNSLKGNLQSVEEVRLSLLCKYGLHDVDAEITAAAPNPPHRGDAPQGESQLHVRNSMQYHNHVHT